jgi:DNA-binding NtrC family response regulator
MSTPQIPRSSPDGKETILIVDDQPSLCSNLKRYLRKHGYRTVSCNNANEAQRFLRQEHVDLVLTDICMPGKNGLELLAEIKARGGNQAVIMMTAFATISQSIESIRLGASDYITKPFKLEEVAIQVKRALLRRQEELQPNKTTQNGGNGHQDSRNKNALLDSNGGGETPLIGHSEVMQDLLAMIERIAPTDSSVLITGATGTGKELVARLIHEKSDRRNRPFVDINCSAIPDTLIEAELFGHQRGTFTGANETRAGLFEEANGGTIFLDEIDALDPSAQSKLLRVLQEREIRRVGGRVNIAVDVRIISATNRDLHKAVTEQAFRDDLLYRLCVVPLHIPELFERRKDIPLLIEHFCRCRADQHGMPPKPISPEAMKVMMNYRWPGNVRELENAIEYALVIGDGEHLEDKDLPPVVTARQAEAQTSNVLQEWLESDASLSEVERRYVLLTLERHNGHQINAASALGIDRRTLSRKLQQYGTRILKREANSKAETNTY